MYLPFARRAGIFRDPTSDVGNMTVEWAAEELQSRFPWLIKHDSVKPSAFMADVSRFATEVQGMKMIKGEDSDAQEDVEAEKDTNSVDDSVSDDSA